jgi:hypothetical protein
MAISDEHTEAIKQRKDQPASLSEQMADAREKAALSAFEADARNGESVDVVDILPSGEVAERMSEGHDRKGDPAAKIGKSAAGNATAKLGLPAAIEPAPQVMASEIKREIRKEMREVRSEVARLGKDPAGNAFELSQSIELLRKLKTLLSEIAFRSAEYIRNLWLAITQGQKVTELV